jgi:hypothetical protein
MTDRIVRCNTCKFGDWGFRGPVPCKDCIGFHKWLPKLPHATEPEPDSLRVELECDCGNRETTFRVHPLTGFVYNSDWTIRCTVCSRSMREVKNA